MTAILACTLAAAVVGAKPKPQSMAAFDSYVAQAEAQIRRAQSSPESFLNGQSFPVSQRSEMEARLRRGDVLVDRGGPVPAEIPGGLIHHWVGTAFIPGASIPQILAVLQDYDRLVHHYHPEVVSSKLMWRHGDDFHISMRLRKHKVITVVLDTEYDVHYGRLDAAHQYSHSRSTQVAEIADAGERDEHPLPEAEDHGFLWRLNTYWRFVQADGGVFVRCEAISLTRDIPTGLGWLIGPFIQSIPRESLQFTLSATRNAVLGKKEIKQTRTR
jgi:hypothetical protein